MSSIAGPYTATFNSLGMGQIENGFTVQEPGFGQAEMIRGDNLGPGADQDGVTQGGNCYISFVLMEYNVSVLRGLISPGSGGVPGVATPPGRLLSDYMYPLVLTKVSGSNATPSIRTFRYACLAPNNQIEYFMGNNKRFVPIRMQAFPYTLNGIVRYFEDT